MSALQIQRAIFLRLKNETTYPVFDYVEKGQAYPYIKIGDDTHVDYNDDDKDGLESTVTIHCWSTYKGAAEVKEMQQAVISALNRHDLAVSGSNTITMYQEYQENSLDPDGVTHHGVQRFRLLTIEE